MRPALAGLLLLVACPRPAPPPGGAAVPASERVALDGGDFGGDAVVIASVRPPHVPVSTAGDPDLERIVAEARGSGRAWSLLAELCDDIGPRLSGSEGLDRATDWAEAALAGSGVKAWTEPVRVPRWVRGEESLEMLAPRRQRLAVLGLGGTVGTEGVEAPVAVVRDLDAMGPELAGRIALVDVPMPVTWPAVKGYGATNAARTRSARLAAEHGAVAVLVRSRTTRSLYTPHTGAMEPAPIPAAAVTVEDAEMIARLVESGREVRLRLALGARTLDDGPGANVLAELPGRDGPDGRPEEIVVIAAHLDSWDVGQGAQDDGAGVVQVIEAMRILASMDRPPRRTVRAVLFTNEENGLRGARAYAEAHAGERVVAAVETDLGGGWPLAWSVRGTDAQRAWVEGLAAPLGLPVRAGHAGADVGPLARQGATAIGLVPDDTRYFDVHHSRADTLDKVAPGDLREALAALAALAWRLAEAPEGPPAGEEP